MVKRHRQYNTVEAVDVKYLTIVIPICVYIQRVVYLSQIASTTVTTTPRVLFLNNLLCEIVATLGNKGFRKNTIGNIQKWNPLQLGEQNKFVPS